MMQVFAIRPNQASVAEVPEGRTRMYSTVTSDCSEGNGCAPVNTVEVAINRVLHVNLEAGLVGVDLTLEAAKEEDDVVRIRRWVVLSVFQCIVVMLCECLPGGPVIPVGVIQELPLCHPIKGGPVELMDPFGSSRDHVTEVLTSASKLVDPPSVLTVMST